MSDVEILPTHPDREMAPAMFARVFIWCVRLSRFFFFALGAFDTTSRTFLANSLPVEWQNPATMSLDRNTPSAKQWRYAGVTVFLWYYRLVAFFCLKLSGFWTPRTTTARKTA
ncbi:hypothetical protein [Aliiruegeria lutimaris]|uniref:hypothetical protein n=1 Tax=Aliiruegeria lutimaris TaxID=571298 RepID=UPI00147EF35E|nr:hypothetical protein [Aliiruegeria lutimaris]